MCPLQVSSNNKLKFRQMIRLDTNYFNNLSLWNDIRIIIKTPYTILKIVAEATLNKIGGNYKRSEAEQDIRLIEKVGSV